MKQLIDVNAQFTKTNVVHLNKSKESLLMLTIQDFLMDCKAAHPIYINCERFEMTAAITTVF